MNCFTSRECVKSKAQQKRQNKFGPNTHCIPKRLQAKANTGKNGAHIQADGFEGKRAHPLTSSSRSGTSMQETAGNSVPVTSRQNVGGQSASTAGALQVQVSELLKQISSAQDAEATQQTLRSQLSQRDEEVARLEAKLEAALAEAKQLQGDLKGAKEEASSLRTAEAARSRVFADMVQTNTALMEDMGKLRGQLNAWEVQTGALGREAEQRASQLGDAQRSITELQRIVGQRDLEMQEERKMRMQAESERAASQASLQAACSKVEELRAEVYSLTSAMEGVKSSPVEVRKVDDNRANELRSLQVELEQEVAATAQVLERANQLVGMAMASVEASNQIHVNDQGATEAEAEVDALRKELAKQREQAMAALSRSDVLEKMVMRLKAELEHTKAQGANQHAIQASGVNISALERSSALGLAVSNGSRAQLAELATVQHEAMLWRTRALSSGAEVEALRKRLGTLEADMRRREQLETLLKQQQQQQEDQGASLAGESPLGVALQSLSEDHTWLTAAAARREQLLSQTRMFLQQQGGSVAITSTNQ